MLTAKKVRLWYRIHKWTSLICTVFLLMSCLTGLPLVFSHEIFDLSHPHVEDDDPSERMPEYASLDSIVAQGKLKYPGEKVFSLGYDDDDRLNVYLGMTPAWNARPDERHTLVFAAHSGRYIGELHLKHDFLFTMLRLHEEIYAGLPGELFLGCMALLFVVALVSGAVVYGPFMRKLDFGTVRKDRVAQVKWFDLHNLLGIVTLAWALVVGVTGAMNTLVLPLFALWSSHDLPQTLAAYKNVPLPTHLSSADAAIQTAKAALPNMEVASLIFPNNVYGSPRHYVIWAHGKTPVTGRLFDAVLIDADTGKLTIVKGLPWYLRALEVSRPLHFGDYGGMPLKIIWALFDLVLITVLFSGLYLWVSHRRAPIENALDKFVELEEPSAAILPSGMEAR